MKASGVDTRSLSLMRISVLICGGVSFRAYGSTAGNCLTAPAAYSAWWARALVIERFRR